MGVGIGGWTMIWLARDNSIWGAAEPFAAGIALGIVMAHFIIDAGVWKLRKPFQREAIKESFSFLFERA
jgi:hypothetical protein